jgi:uncharacterized protein YgbK (DUF1537 family)
VRAGSAAIAARLEALGAQGAGFAIVDAICDADLLALGEALADAPLAVGGSAIALGLPANFRRRGLLRAGADAAAPVRGRAAVLAGSCSKATRAQVAAYAGPVLRPDLRRVVGDPAYPDEVARWCLAQASVPLVASTSPPDEVAAAASVHGERLAAAIEQFFGRLAARLAAGGVRRFVVAGGETSGAVVAALGVRVLAVGAEIDPGVPVLFASEPEPLALALKSGNFGAVDFFARALAATGAES